MARLIVDGMSVFKSLAGAQAHLDRGYAYSFLTQVTAAVKKMQPTGVDFCWEGGHKRRTQLLPDYKSNRTDTTPEVRSERAEVQKLMRLLGANQYYAPGYEADDMIARLVKQRTGPQIIMSGDKDMLQLVASDVSVYQKVRKTGTKTVRELITKANFQEKTGWPTPAEYLRAHCALGDAVDKIPKVAGVGEGVIHAYFLGMEVPPSKRAKLDAFYANSPQFLLNMQLIDLTNPPEFEYVENPGCFSEGEAYRMLEALGFSSIYPKFDTWIVPWYNASGQAALDAQQAG